MVCLNYEIELSSSARTDIFDVTEEVQKVVLQSGLKKGLVTVHTPGSTAAVTTIEYESGALSDFTRVLENLAPVDGEYAHNARWGDGNGYSHVRAALLGPSLCVPVKDGGALLGAWQQIIVLDFDNRPRKRRVIIQVLGERG
ncbi:secondary thiamine-phosphate synthase enzyme YjbQ [Dethiosulfatarculus sandiegensis]|uniref:Secondary thiamine-phosphate synthase enzyme n=1 Tax=Dethiosulfatarculus sandiegensis TaxID=1429043 RepID=A0A0D2G807_9BACT|nr:secondary thiamine-phosphate synthase enzyme YjbQ [Dethiosulfatarculus sandiegensis]KIX11072.1 hypothetical protein X474_25310 [Dethiosulfatarculus sandiegensis]